MHFRSHVSFIICSIVFLSGCVDKNDQTRPLGTNALSGDALSAVRTIITEKNARFTRAHVTGERAIIDTMFTLDARSLPPGTDPVVGRSAIAELTTQYLQAGVSEFHEETVDFYGNDAMVIDQGNYRMVYGKEKVVEQGKYLNVWKKVDGDWKIYSNIWNTNAP